MARMLAGPATGSGGAGPAGGVRARLGSSTSDDFHLRTWRSRRRRREEPCRSKAAHDGGYSFVESIGAASGWCAAVPPTTAATASRHRRPRRLLPVVCLLLAGARRRQRRLQDHHEFNASSTSRPHACDRFQEQELWDQETSRRQATVSRATVTRNGVYGVTGSLRERQHALRARKVEHNSMYGVGESADEDVAASRFCGRRRQLQDQPVTA